MPTYSPDFDRCLPIILQEEGGYNPSDPSMHGILQSVYDKWRTSHGQAAQDVRLISDQETSDIYWAWYWLAARSDVLSWPANLCHFDAGVNTGVVESILLLQRALNVKDDGVIGPITLAAMQGANSFSLAEALLWERLQLYAQILSNNSSKLRWAPDWIERTVGLHNKVVGS